MKLLKSTYTLPLFLVAIILTLLFFFWDKISSALNPNLKFTKLSEFGSNISKENANRIAESLYVSMYEYGTDESKIYSLLKGISKPNFNKVYNQFGQRYYSAETGIYGNPLIDKKLDLWGWLNSELSESELKKLKLLSPNIFT